ncbi:MAG: AraC family transcriptional regulator, partial [Xenophilus sp.]
MARLPADNPAPQPIHVVFALLEDSLVLDWAGPAEALRIANRLLADSGRPPRFDIEFAAPRPQLRGSVGVQLAGLAPLPAHWDARPAWIVLVGQPGNRIDAASDDARALLHWLRGQRLAAGRLELLAVCAGTVLAAAAPGCEV